ncbi:MAG: acetyltransferase [Solirubrobacterales bacterium]|nr:acetyltransferase [Solirubrobacterales bacterium]
MDNCPVRLSRSGTSVADLGYGRGMTVSLRALSRENVRTVCDLRVAEDQRHLVGPAAYTVAEGHYEPDAVLRTIYLDEEPVGVLLVEVESGTPYLVRFMVDAAYQPRGVGRRAVELLAEELRRDGWASLEASFVRVDNGARGFWRRCGFQDTGRTRHGEPVFVRAL